MVLIMSSSLDSLAHHKLIKFTKDLASSRSCSLVGMIPMDPTPRSDTGMVGLTVGHA